MTILTKQATTRTDIYTDKINKYQGQTIDRDGLANNYAIKSELDEEDVRIPANSERKVTVVDIFASKLEAKSAVLEIERKGLRSQQISIIAKGYQDTRSCMTWEGIEANGGLALVLTEMGINDRAIGQFLDAVEDGKYLIIVTGSDRQASMAEHVLESFEHRVVIVN
jgi:hypothetical protein